MSNRMKEDWVETTLGEVCFTTSGGTPKRSNKSYYQGKIPWVKSGELDKGVIYDSEEHITEDAIKNSSAKLFPKGTLLFALYGATIGKMAVLGVEATTNQAICGIFKSEIIRTSYLFNYLQFKKNKLIGQGIGGAQPNISQTILKQLEIPLPPLPIQRAIVAKIEELFSSLDSGIADLKKAQDQLVIYRQAVLKKVFENDQFPLKTITEIVEKVQIGPFGSQLHKADYVTDKIPLINPMHIQEGKIIPSPHYTISKEKRDSLPNYILQEGDVILGRRGEMGRSALVSNREKGWFCGTGSLYLRPDISILLPSYLNKYIQSSKVKELLTGSATGTTMMNLNKKIVNSLPVPLPTLKEQHQIVREIESRLSVCDKVEESISESLEKAQALRQSILKKAFEGKLLSTEEIERCKKEKDYEPASVLLARIERSRNERIKKEKKK